MNIKKIKQRIVESQDLLLKVVKDSNTNLEKLSKNFNSKLVQRSIDKSQYLLLKGVKNSNINFKNFAKNINLKLVRHSIEKSQDWILKIVENKGENVELRQSAIWAKSITWTLISGTAFGIGWLAFAKTDEIIVSRGILEPFGGVSEVQVPLGGVAQEILVKEGDIVKKGEILIRLDNKINNAKLKASEESLEINLEIFEKLKLLKGEGAISEFRYLQQKNKIAEIKSLIEQEQVKSQYNIIRSPVRGLVFDLKPSGPGYVARSSEPLMKIVPIENLKASIEINSNNIGFVTVGKRADISIDSYPASDFGVIKGRISKLSSDALPPDPRLSKGYRFPAEILLDEQYLQLKDGKKLPLQVGMSLSANINLRKVSYLQLLLNTFSQKAGSLRKL